MTPPPRSSSVSVITLLSLLLVGVLIVGGMVLVLQTRPVPVEITIRPPLPTSTAAPSETPGPILVYVTGAVNQPNTTVSIPSGSRVQEAVDAAGGLTDEADESRVNMAAVLRDGDQVHVPSLIEPVTSVEATSEVVLATPPGGTKVFINTATLEELQELPGVGPALAQRIIDYRQENGLFTSLEDLDQISGIGPALLEDIGPLVVFE